jgi:hypothetical protein
VYPFDCVNKDMQYLYWHDVDKNLNVNKWESIVSSFCLAIKWFVRQIISEKSYPQLVSTELECGCSIRALFESIKNRKIINNVFCHVEY